VRRLLTTLVAISFAALPALASADRAPFSRQPVRLATQKIFDLGVTDYNDDGRLDLYTNNHKFEQSLLQNRGGFRFRDRLGATRLAPTPQFPGIEDILHPPRRSRSGLYVYMRGVPGAETEGPAQLNLRLTDPSQDVSGHLEFNIKPTVMRQRRAEVTVTRDAPRHWIVDFDLRPGAALAVKPRFPATPYDVSLGSYPLDRVFVGSKAAHPSSDDFRLTLRDRHGTAWADLDGDKDTDAFWVVGGFRGLLANHLGLAQDQQLLQKGKHFEAIDDTGVDKGDCRGRQAEAADYDRDGRLDLFESCLGQLPRLFRQSPSGSFMNVSSKLGAVRPQGLSYRWAPIQGKGGVSLVAAYGHSLSVYHYGPGNRWRRADRARLRGRPLLGNPFAFGDFDNDGDLDIFAASEHRNTLAVNHAGKFQSVNPSRRGLPSRGSESVAWVDYNNDGRLDFYSLPGGLFRARARGGFARTGLLTGPQDANWATVAWPDLDRNGSRDLVQLAAGPGPSRATMMRHRSSPNHWLELDLHGARGNRQAMGAKATLRTGRLEQTQWVGQNETSRFGQGHYRLYYGLGRHRHATITVKWPDGSTQKVRQRHVDRLVTVSQR
jgi:hypothetical protein